MLMGLTFTFKHPEVKPALLTHLSLGFLCWTDGSIGLPADLTTGELKSFILVMPIGSLILKGKKTCKPVLMVLLWLQPKLQEMRFFTSIPYYFLFQT
jgi:hypothetical protein